MVCPWYQPKDTSKMKALLLLYFVLYADAQLVDLSKGRLVHFGPFDTSVQIGNSTNRYLPLTSKDIESSKNALILLEEARRMFKVGFNVYPPLDPYKRSSLPPFSLDSNLKLIKGEVRLQNLILGGAKRFRQNLLELRLNTGRVDFEFTIPSLDLQVDYHSDVLLADLIPLHLEGHLSLFLNAVKVVGNVHVDVERTVKDFNFRLVALHYDLHIGDVAVQLRGSNVNLNKLIKDSLLLGIDLLGDILTPSTSVNLIHNINTYVANIVLLEANHMLLVANTEQIMAYLLPESIS